jgi:uncharacterized membrane protein YvlD (DUF360 family)
MTWYEPLGVGIFWIALVVAIIIYSIKRKWYPIMYLISASLYIFTVGFVIDVFNFTKNSILITLALSALIMIGLGAYLSRKLFK